MKIAIEKSFLSKENINDDLFYASLIAQLEEIMEEELSKDMEEMNTELVDDCCVAIENLRDALEGKEKNDYKAFSDVEKIIKRYNKKQRNVYVASVACAAVAVFCAVASVKLTNKNAQGSIKLNSFLDDVFNVYEQTAATMSTEVTEKEPTTKSQELEITTSTEQATIFSAQETTTVVSETTPIDNQIITTVVPQTTKAQATEQTTKAVSTTLVPHIYKITVLLPPDFKTEYTDKAQINLSQVKVRVNYSNETEKVISIDECDVEIGEPDKNGRIKITVMYNHMYSGIYVNIRTEKEKNPVTLNSIYGSFDSVYNVDNMSVYAVYSDGTEKEIPKGEYTVKQEYSEDFEAEIVIVEYSGCSFQFLPEN